MRKIFLIIILASVVIGSIVALFLTTLEAAIHFRFQHTWLLYLLPLAGVLIHFINQWNDRFPIPVIFFTTIFTHLFGGSAGREGTAVQIGGSTSAKFSKWFKINQKDTALLLTCGAAAGFGAVFGTPVTGAIFAVEVLTLGRINYKAFFPGLLASSLADLTVSAWGVQHHQYLIDHEVKQNLLLFLKIALASVTFGLASLFFIKLKHHLNNIFQRFIRVKALISVVGGLMIIGLTFLIGKPDYLSLGVDAEYHGAVTIPSAFEPGGADAASWFWKSIYTAITLSSGFKGGEVTPLFYIGATLGNALSALMNAPVSLFAALGFIAVFAGATNTPLACTVMGIELFGPSYAILFALACYISYFCSGYKGIYAAQNATVNGLLSPHPLKYHRYWQYLHIKMDKYRPKFSPKRKSK